MRGLRSPISCLKNATLVVETCGIKRGVIRGIQRAIFFVVGLRCFGAEKDGLARCAMQAFPRRLKRLEVARRAAWLKPRPFKTGAYRLPLEVDLKEFGTNIELWLANP